MMQFGLTADQRQLITDILDSEANGIEQVSVFGSRADGSHRPTSDIDLVLYGHVDELLCDRLWTLFHESRLPFAVDIKSYAAITWPLLRAHIDAVARPLLVQTGQGLRPVAEPAPEDL